jgi:hypothetical protein
VRVCNNSLLNARTGISSDTGGGSAPTYPLPTCSSNTFTSSVNFFGNTLNDHAWQFQPSGSSSPVVNIFGNDVSGNTNWLESGDEFHTDGIIAWGDMGVQLTLYAFDNLFHDTAYGTAAIYCTYGQTGSGCEGYIFNNVFEVDSADANSSAAIWLNGTSGYPLGPYYLYNNTFVNNGVMIVFSDQSQPVVIENNLVTEGTAAGNYFYSKGYGTNTLPSILTTSDYNSFYGGRGLSFSGVGIYYGWPTGSWGSYSSWTTTGFDTHSVSANPQINGSYQLSNNSPDIRAGANLFSLCGTPGLGPLCYDKNGVARPATGPWDIGAFQFRGPNSPVGLTGTAK